MGQKFDMTPLSPQEQAKLFSGGVAGGGGADTFGIDPSLARPIVRNAAERANGFDDPIDATKGVEAPGEVAPLVAGAFDGFLEARRESIRAIKDRAVTVTDGAMRALAAYDAGDEEMVRSTLVAMTKAGAKPFEQAGW